MTSPFIRKSLLGAALMALTAFACEPAGADVSATDWMNERAMLFSSICMKSAPSFASFGSRAKKAGFAPDANGNLYLEPEIVLSLDEANGECACQMTFGALEQTPMVKTVFAKLLDDFPNDWRPEANQGTINDVWFDRDGRAVHVRLVPIDAAGTTWVGAVASVKEGCPK